ncbi:hypothetical protein GW12_24150 [Acinetobacter sp. HR7]|nr:hypothetical protein GW12_24150 [Acinetobacter sp. HR7]
MSAWQKQRMHSFDGNFVNMLENQASSITLFCILHVKK